MKLLAGIILKAIGWEAMPYKGNDKHAVFVFAHHTSMKDGFLSFLWLYKNGLRARILMAEYLFTGPLGPLAKALGFIKVERSNPRGLVKSIEEEVRKSDSLFIGICPEGTRSLAPGWKSGFYRIALDSGLPVVLGTADYKKKVMYLSDPIKLTGNAKEDMDRVRDFYRDVTACYPENASPIKIRLEESA